MKTILDKLIELEAHQHNTGPWEWLEDYDISYDGPLGWWPAATANNDESAALIVAMRNALPLLLDVAKKAQAFMHADDSAVGAVLAANERAHTKYVHIADDARDELRDALRRLDVEQ